MSDSGKHPCDALLYPTLEDEYEYKIYQIQEQHQKQISLLQTQHEAELYLMQKETEDMALELQGETHFIREEIERIVDRRSNYLSNIHIAQLQDLQNLLDQKEMENQHLKETNEELQAEINRLDISVADFKTTVEQNTVDESII